MIKVIRKIAHGQNSLKGAAGILVVTLFLSNVLGVLRNYLLTRYIPVPSLDIYYASFRLPDLIFNLLILGAISSAFIPVFTNYWQKKDETSAWYVANAILNIAIICLIIALTVLYFLMPYIIHLIVPSFTLDKQTETVRVARILLLSPFFFGISYIFGAILNSYQRFVASSLAPLVYNLSIIVGAAVLAPLYPRGDPRQLTVIALSVVVGALLHMLIQFPSLRHMGFRFRWLVDYRHEAVRRVGKLMIPRTIGLGANELMLVTFTALASASAGAVSYFSLANDIQTMPTVVFGLSFATAIFPSLSSAAAAGDKELFAGYITRTIKIIVTLIIPSAVGLILLRVGLVQSLLGFNLTHVIPTAATLAMFSLSLIASGLMPLFARVFYADQDTRTPTYISVSAVLISIIAAYLLRGNGAPGLALAFSTGSFYNAVLLYIPLRRRHPLIGEKEIFITTAKVILASLIMGLVIYATSHLVADIIDVRHTRIGMITQVVIAGLTGLFIYLGLAWLFGVKEVRSLWQRGVRN